MSVSCVNRFADWSLPKDKGRARASVAHGFLIIIIGAVVAYFSPIPGVGIMTFGTVYTLQAQRAYLKDIQNTNA